MAWKRIGKSLWRATKATGRGAAELTKLTKDVVVRNKDTLATAGRTTLRGAGALTSAVGTGTAAAARVAANAAHQLGDSSSGSVGKALGHAVGYIADGTALVGEGAARLGRGVSASAQTTADAVTGAVAGGVSVLSESLDALAISDNEISQHRHTLVERGEEFREQSEQIRNTLRGERSSRASAELLDRLVVGGITLSAAINAPADVPAAIEKAFEAAYPQLAASESFGEVAARLSPEQLGGFVAGVKGKLFEVQFVEQLNAGALPEGYVASMAPSATQAGWDIQITDDQGQVVELLQAKATESASYVRQALENYPGIDVTTTSEVYAQLAAIGVAEGLRDSGITEAALEEAVRASIDGSTSFALTDLLPSAVGLAVIGLTIFLDPSISPTERVRIFGERGARAGVSSIAGYGVLVLTQTWWLAVIGGLGTHWLTGKGRSKRAQLDSLKSTLRTLRGMKPRLAITPRPA